jgi:multicomponent Na+:H+ antiporter subunit C
MAAILPVIAGVLFAAGFYLMLRRTLGQLVIGLAMMSNAANLLIFSAGRISTGGTPIVPEGATAPIEGSADPLPQALILTAIVIGFGILAFFIVLVYRAYQATGSDDVETYSTTDRLTYGEKSPPPLVVLQPPSNIEKADEGT